MVFKLSLACFFHFLSTISCNLNQGRLSKIILKINHLQNSYNHVAELTMFLTFEGGAHLSSRNSTMRTMLHLEAMEPSDLISKLFHPEVLMPRIFEPGVMSTALEGILKPEVIVVHVAQNAVAFFASCLAWYEHLFLIIQVFAFD